jgi:hypothetical protein
MLRGARSLGRLQGVSMSETEMAWRRTWRLIGAAVLLGVLCTGGILATLRADAQTAAATATSDSDAIPDDPTIAPDARQSADNNVSFPTDI